MIFASDRTHTPPPYPATGRRVIVRAAWWEFVPDSPLPSAGPLEVVYDEEQAYLLPRGDVAVLYAGRVYYVNEHYVEDAT